MSSQDSMTMVLKCMLRGAADYLIKPMRKNELKNLWQHVWRRLTVSSFRYVELILSLNGLVIIFFWL